MQNLKSIFCTLFVVPKSGLNLNSKENSPIMMDGDVLCSLTVTFLLLFLFLILFLEFSYLKLQKSQHFQDSSLNLVFSSEPMSQLVFIICAAM